MARKGILIAVEGLDGSGKSTQAHLLNRWLTASGVPVHHTEWNSSPHVAAATKIGKNTHRLTPETFHLIHAADFADRWERQIEPMLAVGGVVICDRYKFTAMARDGARGIPLDRIEATYVFARDPDLTIYFETPIEVALNRILHGRPELKYYEAGLDMGWTQDPYESYRILQTKIGEIYSDLSKTGRIIPVSSVGSVSEVQHRARGIIHAHLDLSNIDLVDPSDRLANTMSLGQLEWTNLPGSDPS